MKGSILKSIVPPLPRLIPVLLLISVWLLGACANSNTNSTNNNGNNGTANGASSGSANAGNPNGPADGQALGQADVTPVTFTMFNADPGEYAPKSNRTIKMIEEMTGVTLEIEYLVGDLEQKMGVMIASGDYPDIISPGQGRARFLTAGAFVDVEGYLPEYPNLWKHYQPYIKQLKNVSPDKKIYLLDIWGRNYWHGDYTQYLADHNGPAFWVQKDVLAHAGYIIPKTLDEFFTMLTDYYKAYPTIDGQPTLPFEILSYDWRSFCLKNAPQHLIGAPNDGDVYVDKTNYTAEIYQNKWYAKDYYQKLNEEFKKGLISPETFTQNYDQYLSKISTGRVLAMFDQQWNFQDGENVLISEDKIERTYVPIGLTYEGYEQWYREEPHFTGGNGLGISVKCQDVQRVLSFMDQLLDEEVQRLLSWGMEGVDYYVENGRLRRTPEQKANWDNPDWRLAHTGEPLRNLFPKVEGQFSDGNATAASNQPEEKFDNQFPYDKEFFSHYGFSSKSDFLTVPGPTPDYYPVWAFTLEDGSDAKVAFDQITDTENRYLPGVIMAEDFESAWAEYETRYHSINYAAYEAEVNRQIAERMN